MNNTVWFTSASSADDTEEPKHLRHPRTRLAVRRSRGHRLRRPRTRPRSHPIFKELQGLILKTVGLAEVVRDALKPLANRIRWAFVYGSVARSEEHSANDVDLMIIGHVGLADVSGPLRKAERRLSRTMNPTTYTADEFTSKVKPNQHFITTVIPHIRDRVQCCPATVQDGSRLRWLSRLRHASGPPPDDFRSGGAYPNRPAVPMINGGATTRSTLRFSFWGRLQH